MMMTFFLLSMEVSFTVRRAKSEYRVDIYLSGHLTNTPYIFVSYHAKIICTKHIQGNIANTRYRGGITLTNSF